MTANPAYPPRPARTSAKGRRGVAEGTDPTTQSGQTPADLFGVALSHNTGAPGTAGAHGAPADPTVQAGQLDEDIAGIHGADVTETGVPANGRGVVNKAGGETVTFTDPFAIVGYGNDAAESSVKGVISGIGDWTQANTDGYAAGPTLPGLEHGRPTSTGAGDGRVRENRP